MNGILSGVPMGALMDPRDAALTQIGLGLMAGSGPSRTPVPFGQAFGQAGMQGMQAYQQANQANQQQQLFAMKMAEAQRAMEQKKAQEAALAELAKDPRFAGMGPMFQVAPAEAIKQILKNQTESPFSRVDPKDYTPESVRKFSMTKNFADLEPVRKMDVAPSGQVYNPWAVKPGDVLPDPNKPFSAGPTGPVPNVPYQEYEKGKAEAGATRVQTNVSNFTPASEEAQKEFMKGLRSSYDNLKTSGVVLDNIEKAKALIPQAKGFMGTGGESLLEAAKFLNNRLGMNVDTQGVKNAEELRSRVFFQIMENLKKMDAQPSQQQQIMMRDALGKLGTDPNALGAVLDAYGDVVKGKVAQHNTEAQGAIQRGVKFPYDPIIKLEAPSIAKPQRAPAEVEDWVTRAMKRNMVSREIAIREGKRLGKVPENY